MPGLRSLIPSQEQLHQQSCWRNLKSPGHTGKPLGNTRSLILEKKWLSQQLRVQGEGVVLLLQNRGASGELRWKQVPNSRKRRVLAQPWSPWLQDAASAQGSKGKQDTSTESKPTGTHLNSEMGNTQ